MTAYKMSRQSYFTEQLNYYLQKKGVSKGALAAALGCLPSIVEAWTKGERYPDEKIIESIATYFGLSKDTFSEKKMATEEEENNSPAKKIIAVGHCVRCGKPIHQNDKYGMGTARRVIKSEFLKNPVEEVVYEYDPEKTGYDYFCEACCDYLVEEARLVEQKKNRIDLKNKRKIKKRAFLIGFLTLIAAFLISFVIVWNPFKWFPWTLQLSYKTLTVPGSMLVAYYVSSFAFVTMCANNWVGKGIGFVAKLLFADSIGSVYKSDNSVLHMMSVKIMVAITIVLVCTIIFIPIALIFGIFAMFAWPHSSNVLNKDIERLSKIV